MGAKTIKVVVLRDGGIVGQVALVGGFDATATAREAMARAFEQARCRRTDVERVVATGAGREEAPDKDRTMTEVSSAARGAVHMFPEVRTVVDVGAEEGRAIRCDARGKVVDFAINEKCAAGAGAFTEAMSRALEVPLEELGPLSLTSTEAIPLNAQCTVFAESEVVSMIHGNVAKKDMARAVHDAMADPLRLGVMHMLSAAPLCVCVIKAATGVEDSKLSYHLNVLRRARLIGRRKEGSFLMYELTETGKQWLSACSL